MKPWYESWTIWFNAGVVVAFVPLALMLPDVQAIIPDAAMRYVAALVAILNLALRFKTSLPVGK